MAKIPALACLLTAVVWTAGCGASGRQAPDPVPGAAQTTVSGGSGASGASATSGDSAGSSADASRPLAALQLSADDLPSGWRDSSGEDGDYRTTICGVDLEPVPAIATRSLRFSQSAIGPFLAQYLRQYADLQGQQVISQLAAALRGCTGYTVPDPRAGGTATFTVEPAPVTGLAAGDVMWRQTSTGTPHPITADYVMTVRGHTVIVLVSYQIKGVPDPAVLDTAYRALRAKP